MPVYRRHRLVHVHIPKTAGTAVEALFRELDGPTDNGHEWIGEGHHGGRWFEYQHLTAAELETFTGGELGGHDRFAIVRDPYQRLISDFRWRRMIARHYPDSFVPAFDTFEAFLDAIPAGIDAGWDDHIAGADRSTANLLIHTRPQHHFLRTGDGALDSSIERIAYEELPAAFTDYLEAKGIPNDHVGRPPVHALETHLTPATLQVINERYRRDFEVLGYPMIDELPGRAPRTAVLVIAAVDRPIYRHYIESYWRALIEHTNDAFPDIDVYLVVEHGTRDGLLDGLADNVIEDPDPAVDARLAPRHRRPGVPGILSKTVHALDTLQGRYDVFFRTNLSSMLNLTRFRRFLAERGSIGYAGAWVWDDALRSDLVVNDWVGPGRVVEDLTELDDLPGNTFISGSGFFLGAEEAARLVAERRNLRWGLADDVAVGLVFDRHEKLPGFSLRLTRDHSIEEMLDELRSTNAAHIRLEHLPVETAVELWRELEREPLWR
ncbi:MAG: sulfotransferase family 2 domain-containing protein [Actinomycetota bacterium]